MKDSLFYFAADIGMAHYKLKKRSSQKESRSDKQSFIELLKQCLVFFGEPLHYPKGEVTGIDGKWEAH